jgi:hypothetical protein
MLAARHLGRWNGAHVADRCVPHPWLSRSPLRDAVRRESFPVEGVLEARADPLIAAAISPESASSLLALATHRDALLDDLDRLPRALCHWDAHRANLFSRTRADGEVETVAIDWEGLGWGPVGADLSKMLSQTVHFFGVSADALPQVDAALFEHYMEGLRDAGWSGDRAEVRFAYTAASAMRLLLRTATALQLTRDARARASFERATGQPFASIARGFASTLPYYLSLVEEAAAASGRS